jgi:hypothetical protein
MEKENVEAKLYKGMPTVAVTAEDAATIKASASNEAPSEVGETPEPKPISISLESLDLELQHNQSYGFVAAGTGCISNPSGPGC